MKEPKINWTFIITWMVIFLTAYVFWFKMVPGAIEYLFS